MITKCSKFKISAILLSLLVSFTIFAQDSDWYYDKPIKNVIFQNLKNVSSRDIEGVTSSFIGRVFTDEVVSDLYDRVFSLEYFSDVEIKTSKNSDNGKTVTIIISVVERPIITKLKFKGNRQVHTSTLKNEILIKEKDVFIESSVGVAERAVRNYYITNGYNAVTVSSGFEQTDDGVTVYFDIDEGKKTVVSSINFAGNKVISSRTLRKKISLKEVGLFTKGAFQESALADDTRTILSYYMTRGYVDAKVVNVKKESSYNKEKKREELSITFEIFEGTMYYFGGITFSGNQVFSTEKLNSYVKLKPGAIYNESKFQESKALIQNLYYENGYTSNGFYAEVNKDPEAKTVSYVLHISENARSHVENILIKGNERTKDYVITREIPIESGDIFSNASIQNGLRNLYNTQFFSSVVPDVMQGSEPDLVDIVFTVEEQSTTSLDFGFTFSGVSDPEDFPVALFAKIQNSNLFGEGRSVGASTTLSTQEQSISLNYGQNWFMGLPISCGLSLSYSHAKAYALRNRLLPGGYIDNDYYYMSYDQNIFSLAFSVGRRWTPNFAILSVSSGISSSIINNVYDEDVFVPYDNSISLYSNSWAPKNCIWVSGSMDGRDYAYEASKGWFLSERLSWYGFIPEGTFGFAPNWYESEFYLKVDTKAEKYFTLMNVQLTETFPFKLVLMLYSDLAFQIEAGDSHVKQNNQLYIDGMFQGRGWTVYNKTYGRGKAMFANSVELRMPLIPGILAFDLWADAVAIKKEVKDFFTNLKAEDWYFSFGPSLRFSLQQFPLRLLFANTCKVYDGKFSWVDPNGDSVHSFMNNWNFVLSFNITNN